MSHIFSKDDCVRHAPQGPRRADDKPDSIYTVIALLPVEMDGRLRYRIRSRADNVERIVTEEQLSRPV